MEKESNRTKLEAELARLDTTLSLASESPSETFSMPASQFNLFARVHKLATERNQGQADPTTTLIRDRLMPVAEQRERFGDPVIVPMSQLNRMQTEISQFHAVQDHDYLAFGNMITRNSI